MHLREEGVSRQKGEGPEQAAALGVSEDDAPFWLEYAPRSKLNAILTCRPVCPFVFVCYLSYIFFHITTVALRHIVINSGLHHLPNFYTSDFRMICGIL